jgi:rhodanese-related sulfurtransferase
MAEELTPERVRELAESGEAQIVDVRTEAEHEAAHVAGDAHLPLELVSEAANQLDQGRPVVFYCRSGDRSALAAEAFRASGWDASSMEGGLVAWAEAGLPVEPEDGEVISPSGLPPA